MDNDLDSIYKDEGHSNKPSDMKVLLWLFLISFLVAFSPAIYIFIYATLIEISVLPWHGGLGAGPYMLLFSVPAGFAVFTIGVIYKIVTAKTK